MDSSGILSFKRLLLYLCRIIEDRARFGMNQRPIGLCLEGCLVSILVCLSTRWSNSCIACSLPLLPLPLSLCLTRDSTWVLHFSLCLLFWSFLLFPSFVFSSTYSTFLCQWPYSHRSCWLNVDMRAHPHYSECLSPFSIWNSHVMLQNCTVSNFNPDPLTNGLCFMTFGLVIFVLSLIPESTRSILRFVGVLLTSSPRTLYLEHP